MGVVRLRSKREDMPITTPAPTRRDLVRFGAAAFSAASYSRILGANDRINMGLIGAGVRGRGVIQSFQKNKEVQMGAVCDI